MQNEPLRQRLGRSRTVSVRAAAPTTYSLAARIRQLAQGRDGSKFALAVSLVSSGGIVVLGLGGILGNTWFVSAGFLLTLASSVLYGVAGYDGKL